MKKILCHSYVSYHARGFSLPHFIFRGNNSEGFIVPLLCKQKRQILESLSIWALLVTTHVQNSHPCLFYLIPRFFCLIVVFSCVISRVLHARVLRSSNKFTVIVSDRVGNKRKLCIQWGQKRVCLCWAFFLSDLYPIIILKYYNGNSTDSWYF